MKQFSFLLTLAMLLAGPALAEDPQKITVVTWGGAYEAAQRAAFFKPFKVVTGVDVDVVAYTGGLEGLRQRAKSGGWDVIDMTEDQAIAGCEDELLEHLDPFAIITPPRKLTLDEDFLPGAFRPCSIAQIVYSTVIAYDERAFPGEKPNHVSDFFDLDRFPGRRALQRDPSAVLEWALIAEGMPLRQVYDLLSTERGMRVAFRKLETIRKQIVWWNDPKEPAEFLRDGKAAMASGFNGRFFAAANDEGAPITIVWDAQILDYGVWAIPIGSRRKELAKEFIRFVTSVDRLAELAEHISYGPARLSVLSRIGRHWRSQVPMRDHLPNAPRNNRRSLRRDSQWYARTEALRHRRFKAWLAGDHAK